ncbi:MAG: hypothetical protein NDI84_04790 [Steroidobacteraceae bacterium]|nr:hypothetical protein [Steroidobacteraceae bacterium]
MDEFPEWAQPWLNDGGKPITRGLNLALKLEDPQRLPLLLWDIVVARPKIQKAIEELSFIHYARFVPSWDGTALMVITEFDGPLEPYVMDFVIALGDVFDVLLEYVDKAERPRLPVRDHPDEFWHFVRQWNRVPFSRRVNEAALFPADFEYPLYNAYPGQTVIDIVGPRSKLLAPSIDHPADPVDLNDVQGNLLRGYRAHAAAHLFLTIDEPKKASLWLSTVLPAGQKEKEKHHAWGGVMSAAPWRTSAKTKTTLKPDVMTNIGFTYDGLRALLPGRHKDLERFSVAFRDGPERRKELNGDVGPSDPRHWRFGRADQAIHVVLTLHTSLTPQDVVFTTALNALRSGASANGMREVHFELAEALKDGTGAYFDGVYFGYHDGFAQPRIAGQCETHKPDFQPAASPGEFLLGPNYTSIFGGPSIDKLPADLATNGTFGAMRLIEQDVDLFDETVAAGSAKLQMKPELFRAKLLGRWPEGQPLARNQDTPAGGARNDFDYAPSWEHPKLDNDHKGETCPVGAHIRRANPRTALVAGQRHSRRLIRRGMPIAWTEQGKPKKGLLGLFIGASLERQFEFIQQQWLQAGDAASGIRGTQDPIAGVRAKHTQFHVPGHGAVDIPPLVTTRGSLYLFFPGISMLRNLGGTKSPSALDELEARAAAASVTAPPALTRAAPQGPENARLYAQLDNLRTRGLPDWILEFLQDLLFNKVLDSQVVKDLVEHFAPRPRTCAPENAPPPGDIRPLDASFIANPYAAYEKLRAEGRSVVWIPEHGAYWVLGRADVQKVLGDDSDFRQQPSGASFRGLLTMDGERHRVVRREVAEAFTVATKDAKALTGKYADAAIAGSKGLDHFDFMTLYGAAVPRAVFWRIFGLRKDDVRACDALAQTMMHHFGQPARPGAADGIVFADAAVRLTGRLGILLAQSMFPFGGGAPTSSLIDEIAKRTGLGRPLTYFESLMTLVQLALVHMSSQFLLGTSMRNLLMPDPRDKGSTPWRKLLDLRQNKDLDFDALLGRALDEARRVDAPVTIVERFAARDLDGPDRIDGVAFRKDCAVFALVASANRDGAKADSLEEFHWDRQPAQGHLSLGYGVHECVGAWLQQQIVPTALARMMDAMPDLKLCDEDAVPAWYDNIYFRALQSLPVKLCR